MLNKEKSAPFFYIPQGKIMIEEGNNNITYATINKLKLNSALRDIHFSIFRELFKHKYLSAHHLYSILRSQERYLDLKRKNLNGMMQKLSKKGFLIKMYDQTESEKYRENYFYKLSRGTLSYLKKSNFISCPSIEDYFIDPGREMLINHLSLRQALISFEKSDYRITRSNDEVKFKKEKILISSEIIKDGKVIYIEPVRKFKDYNKYVLNLLDKYHKYFKSEYIKGYPTLILLAEENEHVLDIFDNVVRAHPLKSVIFFQVDATVFLENTDVFDVEGTTIYGYPIESIIN